MKKILSVILILILNTPILPLSNSSVVYDNNDINALQKIYNHNINTLNDWDLSNPDDIEELEWDCIDNTYRLISLDLCNTDISGKIDLSEFEYIDYYNFSNTNIKEIILPNSSNKITQRAFEGCNELEYVDIPETINVIENNAFKNCSNLKSVILNNSDIAISSGTFSGCVALECIINANNIKNIGRNAFTNCDKLVFYDENEADTYIENYTQDMNYNFSSDTISNAIGYVSIMTNGKNQSSRGYPYKFGIAYLYDENNNLLEQINLNDEGKFSFSNLLIGQKYKIVIDGQFAIARDFYVVVTQKDYVINTKDNALPMITCDFNKDGIITNTDVQILFSKCASCKSDEVDLYDLDGSYSLSSSDAIVVYSIMAYFNEKGYID